MWHRHQYTQAYRKSSAAFDYYSVAIDDAVYGYCCCWWCHVFRIRFVLIVFCYCVAVGYWTRDFIGMLLLLFMLFFFVFLPKFLIFFFFFLSSVSYRSHSFTIHNSCVCVCAVYSIRILVVLYLDELFSSVHCKSRVHSLVCSSARQTLQLNADFFVCLPKISLRWVCVLLSKGVSFPVLTDRHKYFNKCCLFDGHFSCRTLKIIENRKKNSYWIWFIKYMVSAHGLVKWKFNRFNNDINNNKENTVEACVRDAWKFSNKRFKRTLNW